MFIQMLLQKVYQKTQPKLMKPINLADVVTGRKKRDALNTDEK